MAIGDDDDESQHIPHSISDVNARQLSQLSDMTSPFDASYGNTSRTTVNELLETSVENSHKSNGDAQVITAATENTAAVARHLIKPHGKTGNFWAFYMLYDPRYHPNHRENTLLCRYINQGTHHIWSQQTLTI